MAMLSSYASRQVRAKALSEGFLIYRGCHVSSLGTFRALPQRIFSPHDDWQGKL